MRKEGKGEEETETQKVGGVPERKQSRGSAAAQTQTQTQTQPYQEDSKTRPRNKWNDSSTHVGSVPTPTTRHLDSPKILYPLIGMIDREIDRYTEIWKACKLVSLVTTGWENEAWFLIN